MWILKSSQKVWPQNRELCDFFEKMDLPPYNFDKIFFSGYKVTNQVLFCHLIPIKIRHRAYNYGTINGSFYFYKWSAFIQKTTFFFCIKKVLDISIQNKKIDTLKINNLFFWFLDACDFHNIFLIFGIYGSTIATTLW